MDGHIASRWARGSVDAPSGGWPASPTDVNAGSYGFREYGDDWYDDRIEFHVNGVGYHKHYFNDNVDLLPVEVIRLKWYQSGS